MMRFTAVTPACNKLSKMGPVHLKGLAARLLPESCWEEVSADIFGGADEIRKFKDVPFQQQ